MSTVRTQATAARTCVVRLLLNWKPGAQFL